VVLKEYAAKKARPEVPEQWGAQGAPGKDADITQVVEAALKKVKENSTKIRHSGTGCAPCACNGRSSR